MKKLYIGCTLARHQQIGIHAVINARGRQLWRNCETREEIEAQRDARSIRAWQRRRVRFYQFCSRTFRRNAHRITPMLSSYND